MAKKITARLMSPALQAFLAIVEHHTVHAAAQSLYLTQTAITQRLQKLEQQVQVSLFTRSRRGMVLTTEGEALLRYCQTVESLEGETFAQLQGVGITHSVRIGIAAPSSFMCTRVIPSGVAVMEKFPKLLMLYEVVDDAVRADYLKTGKVQLAVLEPEELAPEMRYKPLKPEKYVLVASSKWKNRKLADILKTERIVDFNPEDQMTFNYLKHYHLGENLQFERHFVNRPDALLELVAHGQGYTVLTEELSAPAVATGDLILLNNGKAYAQALVLAWYDRPEMPGYLRALIDSIR